VARGGGRLCLMDIAPAALELVGSAARICNGKSGSPIAIDTTGDLEAALEGADFVIVSISTGGLEAMAADLGVPERYGIWHTVGDTVGPGGWLRAVRNVPVFDRIGSRARELCPGAWLINVSNPLTVLTRVATRAHGGRCVGLCPGVEEHARTLAGLAGFGPDARIDYAVTGIDHGSWFTALAADGVDVIARLGEMGYCRADGVVPGEARTPDALAEEASSRAVFAIWAEIGYMPAINDRHAVENWPWFLARAAESQIPFHLKRTSIAERRDWLAARRRRLEDYVSSGGTTEQGAGHGDDPVITVVEALAGFRDFTYGVNCANVGQIPELAAGAVVETRARFDACGVHPFASPMPPVIQALVAPQVVRQEAIVDIALRGSFDQLAALVRTDPLCARLEPGQCARMVAEMVEATRRWIANPRLLETGAPVSARR